MSDDVSFDPAPEDFAATFDPPPPSLPEVPEVEEDLSFPEEMKRPFEGLFYIGALRRTFTFAGHQITIRTLTSDELLEVGLCALRYEGTGGRAFGTALAAAALESIDGQPLPIPIVAHTGTPVEHRFNWVKEKLYPPVVDAIYEEYRLLEMQVEAVLDAMGKAGGSTAG